MKFLENLATAWRFSPTSGRAAFACCLALPLALLHARALADILIAGIDLLFLARMAATRDRRWLGAPFAMAALGWWGWLVLCSALKGGDVVQAAVAIRLPLLALALQNGCLDTPDRQRLVWCSLAASALWIAVEAWQQALTGADLLGYPRWGDGALTGPFYKPRAGPALILLLFPVLLPPVCALLRRPGRAPRVAGLLLLAAAVATMVMIGQRMPMVLLVLGLAATALLVAKLRWPLLAAFALGLALLAATPILSPPTYAKLVLRFAGQLQHFQTSSYGLIYQRAAALAWEHKWFGWGFDGFRNVCGAQPGAVANGECSIHPHNYYLQAAVEGGLPGLVLFTAMAVSVLRALGAGLRQNPDELRTGIFVGALLAFWPIASTSAVTSLPNAGWIFLVAGLGLAYRRPYESIAEQPHGG